MTIKKSSSGMAKTDEPGKPWKLAHEISISSKQEDFLFVSYIPSLNWTAEDRRIHAHLNKLSSDVDEQQLQSNLALFEKARNENDEEAFLELISRDPRYLCSDLGLFFITLWQFLLGRAYGYRYVRLEIDTFSKQLEKLAEIHPVIVKDIRRSLDKRLEEKARDRKNIQRCRNNLKAVGHSLLKHFDARGNRPIPPLDLVQPWYYSALILFSGLKRIVNKIELDRRRRPKLLEQFRQEISKIPTSETKPKPPYGLFNYIIVVASAIVKIELRARA
jgi:hypothetical protein